MLQKVCARRLLSVYRGIGMEETILVCEDSIEGVLTAVYCAYEWKLNHRATRIQVGEADLCLFAVYREVETDAARAFKVASTIKRRFGIEAWEDICHALASEAPEKGQAVYQTIVAGISGKVRGRLMGALANDDIRRVFELSRHVYNEEHRMKEFLRFREVEGGVLFARIEPDANVTDLIMPHFADRFPLENFVIVDTRRAVAGIHAAGKEWFLLHMDRKTAEQMETMESHYTEQEREMAELFRHFCHTIGIRERNNLRLQQQFLPLKYRSFMTEFEDQDSQSRI